MTDDGVNDISPRLTKDSDGQVFLLWRKGDQVVMLKGLGSWPPVPVTVRGSERTVTPTDFQVVRDHQDHLVLIWQDASPDGTDIYYSVYDSDFDLWGADQRLQEDRDLEKSFAPLFDEKGDLVMAYVKTGINLVDKEVEIEGETHLLEGTPEEGESSLCVLRHRLTADLGITSEDITLSVENPEAGEIVTIEAVIHNLGDKPLSDVGAAFYDGDPTLGGEMISTIQTIAGVLKAGANVTVSVEWTVPEGYTERLIYVKVDPQNLIAEVDEENNLAYLGAVLPDLCPEEVYGEYLPDGSLSLIATVVNQGRVNTGAFMVELRKDTEGRGIDEEMGTGKPGGGGEGGRFHEHESESSGLGDILDVFIKVDAGGEIEEADEENNDSIFQVYVDGDHDGMPDWWELANKLNRYDEADAAEDADGDGRSNGDEYRDGTDPNDPDSYLATPTPTPTASPTPTPSMTPTPRYTHTPTPSITPTPHPTPEYVVISSGDYDGDGISDIALFRQDTGLWAVRGIGRVYFGTVGDIPVSGDYNGDGYTNVSIFRPATGLWAIKGVTRIYYGDSDDISVPGDYDGDGTCDIAVFEKTTGVWKVRDNTRCYFGTDGDRPVPGDYDGDGAPI